MARFETLIATRARQPRETWRLTLAAAATVLGLAATGAAQADTIDFGQFGPEFTILPNTTSGVTVGGVGFTITGPGQGFTRLNSASGWGAPISEFANGAKLLWDDYGPYVGYPSPPSPGPVTIVFATPITSIGNLGAETDLFGPFTATMTVYDGATVLGSSQYNSPGGIGPAGSLPSFFFAAPAITSIVITTTNDQYGFALGPSVPEPATWAIMLAGMGAVGGAMRRRRSSAVAAADG